MIILSVIRQNGIDEIALFSKKKKTGPTLADLGSRNSEQERHNVPGRHADVNSKRSRRRGDGEPPVLTVAPSGRGALSRPKRGVAVGPALN